MADDARPQRIAGMALLAELLTVIGPIGVLGLWLYQQTELERNAGELRKIAAARAVYQTYQSNNGLFNQQHVNDSHPWPRVRGDVPDDGWIGSWSPGIGDPTFAGWLTAFAYLWHRWLRRCPWPQRWL